MNALQKAALLTLLPNMNKINCTECMHAFREAFDVRIDHHEFAYYLDELYRKGMLEIIKPGGRRTYRLIQC